MRCSSAGGAAAYAEPLADIASTANCDCSCRIVVDPSNGPAEIAHWAGRDLLATR